MDQKLPEAEIQDRKVEVIKQPLAEPLAEPELAHRLDELAENIRKDGCGSLAKRLAQNIADSEYGGRYVNVQNAFPQLTTPLADGKRAFNTELDTNADNKLNGQELTAITLAAGKWMADHPGKTSKDVPLDQEYLDNYKMSVTLVMGPQASTCPLPGTPLFAANTVVNNPGKSR